MNTSPKKTVHFTSKAPTFFHFAPSPPLENTHTVHEAYQRRTVERTLLNHPHSQLETMRRLIASWREDRISVVFGNVGRQPFLLTYFLDLCIGADETVRVVCDWPLAVAAPYQVPFTPDHSPVPTPTDFLIRVEPPFGWTLHHPPNVQHLVVLTSHLSLCYWGGEEERIQFYYLHLANRPSSKKEKAPPSAAAAEMATSISFRPSVFHEQVLPDVVLPGEVLLDVSETRTAHEAFLRWLTGHETLRQRTVYHLSMSDRDREIVRTNIQATHQLAQKITQDKRWKGCLDPKDSLSMESFLDNLLGKL